MSDSSTPSPRREHATPESRRWAEWIAIDPKPAYATAMSTVWRVRRTAGPERSIYALKTLRYRKTAESTAYQRFEREIRILESLGPHVGIVEVVAYSQPRVGAESELYYVMPWADTSLERAAKSLRGHLEQVLLIGVKIADALDAAHTAGVIHRDVKPANILLYGDEREPRVADFGIGYVVAEDRLTRTGGHTVGTDEFVAPELRGGGQNENVTPAVDVYSLGKTLYAVVSGGSVLPREWLDDSRYDLEKLLDDPRLAHLTGLLRRMITERPEDRYTSMSDCRVALQAAVQNLRGGLHYRPDMYGGRDSPVERFVRLSKQLTSLQGHWRGDAIQDAKNEACEAARSGSCDIASVPGALAGLVGAPRPACVAATKDAAEETLAVGAALVLHDDLNGLDEWLSDLISFVRTREDGESAVDRWIMPPMATLALHGVGALAWHRKRLNGLRRIVDAQLVSPHRWIHHYVLGENAATVVPWAIDALATSPVLERADSKMAGALNVGVSCVAGLVALRAASELPPDAIQAFMSNGMSELPIAAFPGFYNPAANVWVAELPREFLERSAFERDVAQSIFDTTSDGFRSTCRRITPFLQRTTEALGRPRGVSVWWVPRVFGAEWSRWCGANGS